MREGDQITGAVARRAVVLAVGLAAAGLVFEQIATLLLAILVSVLMAVPLAAAGDALGRRGVPRTLAVLAVFVCALAVVGGILAVVIPQFVHEARRFVAELPATIAHVDRALGLHAGAIERAAKTLSHRYTSHPLKLLGPLTSFGLSAAAVAAGLVVILITSLYMAISPRPLVGGLLRIVPFERRDHAKQVLGRVHDAWLGWLRGVGIDMLVLGSLLYAGMRIIDLRFAIGFAIFSALMTVIPNYGSIVSAIPPILVGAAHSLDKALLVLLVYVIVNQVEGNVILPMIMSRTVSIHPALVAIGVVVFGSLFGFLGLLLSVPLISLTLVLVEELWIAPMESLDSEPQAPPAGAT